jgi:toxin ParE1/3/4
VRLYWTPDALDDRRTIYDYIEAANPLAALNLDELFSEKVLNLIDHPGLGRIGRVAGTRELVVHKNYILVYDTTAELVRVLRVLHAAMQWPPAER